MEPRQQNTGSLDISRAIQHPFEDQTWINKILIGALIGIVPILGFATIGYMIEVLRNNAEGRELPLPESLEEGKGHHSKRTPD